MKVAMQAHDLCFPLPFMSTIYTILYLFHDINVVKPLKEHNYLINICSSKKSIIKNRCNYFSYFAIPLGTCIEGNASREESQSSQTPKHTECKKNIHYLIIDSYNIAIYNCSDIIAT